MAVSTWGGDIRYRRYIMNTVIALVIAGIVVYGIYFFAVVVKESAYNRSDNGKRMNNLFK